MRKASGKRMEAGAHLSGLTTVRWWQRRRRSQTMDGEWRMVRSGDCSCNSREDRGTSCVTKSRKRGGHRGSSPTERGGGSAAAASKLRVLTVLRRPTTDKQHCNVEREAAGRFVSEGVARARERVKRGWGRRLVPFKACRAATVEGRGLARGQPCGGRMARGVGTT
jgi:hypothetical protein